ncbi:GntR family transcriptional regulator [Sphingomonas sinipercae]|uniref:GntR family transcriptional regulator n=1 Tax=Sphingomonas sinipercae TaxID=2714944 RepID=A0A6G7ZLI0_9SPHN|nr:GntR family transcriptional regulator [Sphingomonas sinipercae]QIL01778.1 GntR family transcriptional regulator [Sphingomonas sinipercae]
MIISVDPAAIRPLYVQISDEVRRLIATGDLSPEDALPSVRQLAADIRINHNTIAQAYRELERDGIVYVRRGQGTFVAPIADRQAQRAKLAAGVAERAINEAHRNGLSTDELLHAIQSIQAPARPATSVKARK